MGSNLIWDIPRPMKEKNLNCDKFFLREYVGEPIDWTFTKRDLEFLKGACAAGRDLQKLIDLIKKHGEVYVKEVY